MSEHLTNSTRHVGLVQIGHHHHHVIEMQLILAMIYAIVTCRLTNNNSLAVICIHLFLLCAPAPLDDSQTLVQSMHNKTC